MRTKFLTIVPAVVLALGAGSAAAAGPVTDASPQLAQTGSGGGATAPVTMPGDKSSPGPSAAGGAQATAAELEGESLMGPDGKKVARVDEVAGDKLILSVGGFLGIGAKKVAVPRQEIDVTGSGDDIKLTTALTEDQLKALPEYEASAATSPSDGAGSGALKN